MHTFVVPVSTLVLNKFMFNFPRDLTESLLASEELSPVSMVPGSPTLSGTMTHLSLFYFFAPVVYSFVMISNELVYDLSEVALTPG